MINIKNANIITEDWVNGEWHGFGPDPAKEGEPPVPVKPAGCEVCSTSCMGDCSGSCVGGCGSASCTGECSLTCESSCSVDCTMTCSESCESNCFNECVNGCKQLCTGACSGVCEGCTGCSGGCIDACVNGCKHSCTNVSTTAGTHVVVPEWPSSMSTDEEVIETLELIKEYLNDIMKYDYTRISDLDEAVVVHDGDTLAGQIISHLIGNIAQVEILPDPSAEYENKVLRYIGETTEFLTQGYFYVCRADESEPPVYTWELASSDVEDVGEINLNDMSIVISDFDNRTVRITAASFVKFIEENYKNYYIWKPYAELNEHNLKTKISWEFCSSGNSDPPESIDLAEIISGGIGRVTEEQDGLMPHELYASSITHEFITGKTKDGDPAPAGTDVLRLTGDGPNTINDDLLDDLDARYAQVGQYMTRSDADQIYVDKTTYAADKNDYLLKSEAATTYLTQASAASTYATRETTNTLSNEITRITGTILPNNYLSKAEAATTYVSQANATSQIPARVAPSLGDNGSPGLMLASDAATLSTAASEAAQASRDIVSLDGRVTALENGGASASTATTNYTTGVSTKGIVQIPAASSIVIGNDGELDIKAHTVTNLIKNSTFTDGLDSEWDMTGEIDDTISLVYKDTTLDKYMANIAILSDGEISQEFISDVTDGFTVGILFKKHPTDAKDIEVKIDSQTYVSYTIPSGTGYVIGEFYIKPQDSTAFGTHTLYIHNPDVSTVSYEFTEVMVQKGRRFTGWMKNSNEVPDVNSINIISYNNNITFKDLVEVYTQDEYALDGVTILHHAGDPIDPSSSIILHKDKNYFYMHITALHEIDGQIRQDVIPLRIDLTTGDCDISGNAVSAGTLIDSTGELIPTVAELNAFVNGSALDLVDQANEITVSTMPTAAEDLVGNIYYYTGETTASFTQGHIYHCVFNDPDYEWEEYTGYQRKYKYSLNKTVNNVVTELASVLHVGRFTGINNAEIFNDYVGNTADTAFTHVEGQGNSALQSATHVHIEGAGNTATGSAAYTHIEGAGNTAENGAAYNHIEGAGHKATGSSSYSHIEGMANTNMQAYDHIEGYDNIGGYYSNHSCGSTMPNGNSLFRSVIVNTLPSISNTYNDEMYLVYDSTNRTYTAWDVNWSSGEGVWENNGSISLSSGGSYGHIEGQYNLMGTSTGHVEGTGNILRTSCNDTHIEGANNIVYEGSTQTHVEGKDHVVYNGVNYSHFEGLNNRSGYTGNGSGFTALHMEGQLNIASSGTNNTHMEGYNNAIQLAGGNTAHIEGYMNRPSQTNYSHIEGYKNSTTGSNYIVHVSGALNTINGGHVGLHVEGKSNVVPYGKSSINASTDVITGNDVGGHIEGIGNLLELNPNNSSMAVGGGYHIEGDSNKITYKDHQNNVMNTSNLLADDNHLEGGGNSICGGYRNHIEGDSNWLYGGATHVEGTSNKVYRADQGHVEGAYNNVNCASGTAYTLYYLHVEGNSNNVYGVTNGSHIEGQSNNIYSNNNAFQIHVEGTSHNLGSSTHNVSLQSIHVEGQGNSIDATVDSLSHSHIEGNSNKVIKIDNIGSQYVNYIHIEGYNNQVNANYSHTEGASNKVYGDGYYNHMEGYNNISHGQYDHTEGLDNHNYGTIGHIEGQNNTIGAYDAVGKHVTNYANHCHVEGIHNLSLGSVNHVEGEYNTAYGNYNHIEGYHNESYAHETHTAGSYNINATMNSTVIGQYNEPDTTYGATSIIPSDITITNTSYISRTVGSIGQVVYDGSTTLGVTDYIELPHMPIGFHFTGTNATGGAIAIYDSNKVCLDVIQMTETGTVDIDVTPYSQTEMITRPNWRDAKYVRLCAVMSTSGLNGAQLFLMKEPHLFIVGNGTFDSSVTPSVTARSNILEVGLDKININGDIYQNGELFKSGTPHFVGTSIEWEALTSEEKAAYEGGDIVFTDDNAGSGIIDQVVTPDSPNPVSGGAVYTAMTNMSNPMVSRSTNGYYTGRKYYDGRTTVHYRRKFTSTSLTANDVTRVVLGDWDGIDSSFNTLITNAFSNNNNVTYMTIIKDAMDVHICQINCISTSLNDHVAYIACIGTGNYTGEFTIDICIDSY